MLEIYNIYMYKLIIDCPLTIYSVKKACKVGNESRESVKEGEVEVARLQF